MFEKALNLDCDAVQICPDGRVWYTKLGSANETNFGSHFNNWSTWLLTSKLSSDHPSKQRDRELALGNAPRSIESEHISLEKDRLIEKLQAEIEAF